MLDRNEKRNMNRINRFSVSLSVFCRLLSFIILENVKQQGKHETISSSINKGNESKFVPL